MMKSESYYRDSVKILDLQIRELAESELKGKDTIKRGHQNIKNSAKGTLELGY